MHLVTDLSPADTVLVTRAYSHALADSAVPPALRFRNGVDDLDAARLLLQLERGAVIVQATSGRSWHTVPRGERMPPLTRVVNECLRLGLVYLTSVDRGPSVRRLQLAAAVIHLRKAPNTTTCSASELVPGQRWRTLPDVNMVDCFACLHLNGVNR